VTGPSIKVQDSVIMGDVSIGSENSECPTCGTTNVQIFRCVAPGCSKRFCKFCNSGRGLRECNDCSNSAKSEKTEINRRIQEALAEEKQRIKQLQDQNQHSAEQERIIKISTNKTIANVHIADKRKEFWKITRTSIIIFSILTAFFAIEFRFSTTDCAYIEATSSSYNSGDPCYPAWDVISGSVALAFLVAATIASCSVNKYNDKQEYPNLRQYRWIAYISSITPFHAWLAMGGTGAGFLCCFLYLIPCFIVASMQDR